MLYAIILLLPAVILFGVMLAVYLPQSKYNQGQLFSIKLPAHAMEHDEIKRIQARYNKQMTRSGALAVILLIPFFALGSWTGFQAVYFLLWLIAVILAIAMPFRRAFRDTLALKRANAWFTSHPLPQQDGLTVSADGDEYWSNGFTYHNPSDRRVFVEKRVGIGLTVNTGTPAGKLIGGGALALLAAVILGVSFMMIRSELSTPTFTVTQDQRIEIAYPMYNFDFAVSDIVQLELVEKVPPGMKTNGEATEKYARGHFRLHDLGKSRLYIFKDNPPYIHIQLADVHIFYNEKDPERTEQLYRQLEQTVNSGR